MVCTLLIDDQLCLDWEKQVSFGFSSLINPHYFMLVTTGSYGIVCSKCIKIKPEQDIWTMNAHFLNKFAVRKSSVNLLIILII